MAKKTGCNIGLGMSIFRRFVRLCAAMHTEVNEMHAPSECHGDVSMSNARAFRTVRRQIKAVTGLRWRVFMREVRRRTTGRFAYIYDVDERAGRAEWL